MNDRSAELLADIAARRERMARGDNPEMWTTPEPRRSPQRKSFDTPMRQAADWSEWDRWVEAHIERTLAAQPTFTKAQVNAIGEALATIRSEIRKEFATEIASLRADTNVQTGIARGEISRLQGSVGLKRGRNAA